MFYGVDCMGLCMGSAMLLVITFPYDLVLVNNHTAHHGIGADPTSSHYRQLQRPLHVCNIPVHKLLLGICWSKFKHNVFYLISFTFFGYRRKQGVGVRDRKSVV